MCSFDRSLLSIEQMSRVHGEGHAGGGEGHSSGAAVEESNSDRLLEPVDRLSEWRLAHVQPLCGFPEMLFLCENEKLLEKPRRHIHTFNGIKTAPIDI